jgi:hypothetical protein
MIMAKLYGKKALAQDLLGVQQVFVGVQLVALQRL